MFFIYGQGMVGGLPSEYILLVEGSTSVQVSGTLSRYFVASYACGLPRPLVWMAQSPLYPYSLVQVVIRR